LALISRLILFLIVVAGVSESRSDSSVYYKGEPSWDQFSQFVENDTARERSEGTAYLVSGALGLVGATIGYQQTTDPFARTVFTISQSMGIAAMGYGTYLLEIGNEYRAFHRAVNSTSSLRPGQRDELLGHFLAEKAEINRKIRMIRAFTHGFIAAVNLYNGSRESDPNLRGLHFFIAGINLVATVSFSF
jgi:hypothetical protein